MTAVRIEATDLDGWLSALEQLHPTPIELGLDRVKSVAEAMGLARMPCPLITVGGTNGKGSTVSYLDAIYRAAGYRVCCQFSPHLLRFNERIRLNGSDASDDQILEALRAVEAGRGEISLTYFEYTVLAAVWLYHRSAPDVIVLEVGLGGRLDATNIWDADAVVLTNVGIDHQRWLGEDREAIGAEKAQIARAGRPAVCAEAAPPASVLAGFADIGARALLRGRDFEARPIDDRQWRFSAGETERVLPMPGLGGPWQLDNAAGAVMAVEALQSRLPVSDAALADGIAGARITGRCQPLRWRETAMLLDVGHNPHGAEQLAIELRRAIERGERLLAASAVMADKDLAGILAPLAGLFAGWYLGDLDMERALPAGDYAEQLTALGEPAVHTRASFAEALAAAVEAAGEGDRVVVFGSFYTVADALAVIEADTQTQGGAAGNG